MIHLSKISSFLRNVLSSTWLLWEQSFSELLPVILWKRIVSPSSKSTLVISHWELENGCDESIYNSEMAINKNTGPSVHPGSHFHTPQPLLCLTLNQRTTAFSALWFWFWLQFIRGGGTLDSSWINRFFSHNLWKWNWE